jgi:hypothetical protein
MKCVICSVHNTLVEVDKHPSITSYRAARLKMKQLLQFSNKKVQRGIEQCPYTTSGIGHTMVHEQIDKLLKKGTP